LGDKITNFSDYKKRESSAGRDIQKDKPKDLYATTEINNIEIEDPYSFFTAEEREEFLREQAKRESLVHSRNEKDDSDESKEDYENDVIEDDEEVDEDYDDENEDEDDEYYEDDEEEEDDEEDDDEGTSISPEFLVRVASIITGVFILAMIAFVVKVKVIDRFIGDPDTQQTTVAALPAGYNETNDTVVVTAQSLNLRTVPSTESDSYIAAKVSNGTSLKRIAVSNDGNWALVEYNGQQLYGSMKYLSTP
jgi:hypothetical protein